MAFYGCEFIFDGIPCSEYGLMVYSFGSNSQSDTKFQSGDIVEDRINGRYDALTYGVRQNGSLEFNLVFGANVESIDRNMHLERYEIEAISSWLTGHQQRKWLSIMQDDMHEYRYKCFITDLRLITHGLEPWAFSCTVSCDSPFGYTYPEILEYPVNGTLDEIVFNRSSYNGYYKPVVELDISSGGNFSICNHDDADRTFTFTSLPTGSYTIVVDNQNQVLTASNSLNLYPYFNSKFLRLVRGGNHLTFTGTATVRLICEFPVDIGG